VCLYGSLFAGCCSIDPCLETCPEEFLHPIAFNPDDYGAFPDASCASGSSFWTCAFGNTFAGCCRSSPCPNSACPSGDLTPAYLDRPNLRQYYGSVSGNTTAQPPVQTASVARIISAPAMSTYSSSVEKLSRREGLTSIAVSMAVMIAISMAVALWLCCRRTRGKHCVHGHAPER
jgi:hypothetical protein